MVLWVLFSAELKPRGYRLELFWQADLSYTSVPKRQNPVRLIFGKNELGAFLESLRPPLSIACPTMAMANL